jgi:hypothetical protein
MFYTVGPSFASSRISDAILCPVRSADMNAWTKNCAKKKSLNLYVEIGFEGLAVQQTEVIERKKAPSWDEKFLL